MENSLLSSQSSDSGLQAVLHPLVLLTISDYITRHSLRNLEGPIVGALLGQQNGREITIEHAFECVTLLKNDEVALDDEWFAQRLEQMRTIHKSPQLDLVGWYTALPPSGPMPSILPIHRWILSEHNESSLLLAFHPEQAVNHTVGSRLPLTIYESNYEADEAKDQGEDREMRDAEAPLSLKLRELPYSVDTSEAEMISIDFVARGAGNATALQPREKYLTSVSGWKAKGKGKGRTTDDQGKGGSHSKHALSPEDDELIASLTAKANAIKVLQSRIELLTAYLGRLPPSFISGTTETTGQDRSTRHHTTPSHTILRSIQALVGRLALLVPVGGNAFDEDMLSEANDVKLMTLLNEVMQRAIEARSIGKQHASIEDAKPPSKRGQVSLNLNMMPIGAGHGGYHGPGGDDVRGGGYDDPYTAMAKFATGDMGL